MLEDIFTTDKKYEVIYADPPWKYNDKLQGGLGGGCPYPCMDSEDIENLPVRNICGKDAILFLWVTMPFLPEGLKVMRAWGFKYKTCAFCWVKQYPGNGGIITGIGKWTLGNAELCLLGVKGHPHRKAKDVKQIVMAERGAHSEKPAEVRKRIERLMGDRPRIELFARRSAPGWDAWGNEVDTMEYSDPHKNDGQLSIFDMGD